MPEPRTDPPASYFLFHGPDLQLHDLAPAIAAERIAVHPADWLLQGKEVSEGPSVLLIDRSLAERVHEFANLPRETVIVAADIDAERLLGSKADLSLAPIEGTQGRLCLLRAAFKLSAERRFTERGQLELDLVQAELTEFNRIGTALMVGRDPRAVLRQVVKHAMRHTRSDTAVIVLIQKDPDNEPRIVLRLVRSDTLGDVEPAGAPTFAVDSTSLVGHVAKTKQPLVIDDVTNLPPGAEYEYNFEITERIGYWVRSALTIPLLNHREESIGVLQLVNHKTDGTARIRTRADLDRYVIPYSPRDVERSRAVAGQAAVLIENTLLYAQIEHLFDCFVKACVTAIDQRDPTMTGHSVRVAALTTDLAEALDRTTTGRYGQLKFSVAQKRELRYAALMHDLGKLSVEEDVLIKAKKLPPVLWERVQKRFDLIRCALESEFARKRVRLGTAGRRRVPDSLEIELSERRAQIDRFEEAIQAANEPTVLFEEAPTIIEEIARHTFKRADGRVESYLAADELHYLRIPQGSLDERERREIESHAAETFGILSKIAWTDDLKGLVDYASGHHEKLDGTGYPRHLTADNIPVQTRMITIADIFDALTAADRPYKRAIPPETALGILETEAKAGLIDPDLVRIMIESEVYRRVRTTDWRDL